MSIYEKRCQALYAKGAGLGCRAVLVQSMPNMRYFSGFTGDSGMLILQENRRLLLTDPRYTEQAKLQAPDFELALFSRGDEFQLAGEFLERNTLTGYEEEFVTMAEFRRMEGLGVPFCEMSAPMAQERVVKSHEEIQSVRQAARIADQAFEYILGELAVGRTEKELALALEFFMRSNGADDVSFDVIVGAGANGAMPHAIPGGTRLKKGDLVVMDFGCKVNGYCSDMTRTVAMGELAPELKNIYNICLKAQLAVLEAIRPGAVAREVDGVARSIISQAGFGEQFGHGLGHGVGLQIHEAPTLNTRSLEVLRPGMLVTDEPGIYLAGKGGVRIEDLVLVTEEGCEPLSRSPKELIIIDR